MATRTFHYDKFIVDGVQHTYLPGSFTNVTEPQWSVRSNSYPALDLKNIIVIEQAPSDNTEPYSGKRVVHRQAWKATWEQESFMSFDMYDHLRILFTLQKTFWLQYDDEMSRDGARLDTIGEDYKSYFTPTYPIAPYGYDPQNNVGYPGTVFVNGYPYPSNSFWVDSELGIVRITKPTTGLVSTDEVTMAYTWRSFVRILSFDMQPVSKVAQVGYVGTVVFEQMRPNTSYDPWRTNYTAGYSVDASGNLVYNDSAVFSGGTWVSDVSFMTQLWGDTRYFSDLGSNPIISYVDSGNTGCGSAGDISCLTRATLTGSLLI